MSTTDNPINNFLYPYFLGDAAEMQEIIPGIRLWGNAVGMSEIFTTIFETIISAAGNLFQSEEFQSNGLDVYLSR